MDRRKLLRERTPEEREAIVRKLVAKKAELQAKKAAKKSSRKEN